ncbi:SGNH/GDSL hydrolase family protein [Austwickia chelonae]|uniref:SGNH/GDSL hydrolase family protein n=1 Tax=Austwickia chelonae TaxID=100225 RepID=UPI000E235891|nr:SGNH/GDSL hydrolase family protein [Austwickia chelonae]
MTLARVTPPEQPWQRYVAIGDSYTEGMCDPDPENPGEYLGWADRLAAMLAQVARREGTELGYANLAVRGRLLTDITDRQLPVALALEPDLISIVGGGNDILRPRADMDALAARLEEAVVLARAAGADVLLATPTDPAGAPLLRHVRGRHAIHTANIWTIARRHGCHVIDQWGMESIKDWRMWAEDRIHMTDEGHRRVALNAFAALGYSPEDTSWETPLPPAPPPGMAERIRAEREWVNVHLRPWVHRRLTGRSSGDHRTAKRAELTHYRDRTEPTS